MRGNPCSKEGLLHRSSHSDHPAPNGKKKKKEKKHILHRPLGARTLDFNANTQLCILLYLFLDQACEDDLRNTSNSQGENSDNEQQP